MYWKNSIHETFFMKDVEKASRSSVATTWAVGSRPSELSEGVHVKCVRSSDIFAGWWKEAKRLLVTISQSVFG